MSRLRFNKPTLRIKGRGSSRTFVFGSIVAIALFFLYLDIRMTASISSVKQVERHPQPSDFPTFKERSPMPKGDTVTPELTLEWDRWADPSFWGSFQYSPTSSVHFPYNDLQNMYHGRKPNFSLKGGYPQAQFMKDLQTPDSDFCLLTRKGNKFFASGVRANQDRAAIISPFAKEGDWWVGLFDGHGEMGHVVAHFANLEFPRLLLKRITATMPRESVVQVLKDIFLDIHKNICMFKLPKEGFGSTGISMLKVGELLYVSNVGDSEAFIASYDTNGNINIIYKTTPHKPDSPEERKRIQGAGGVVMEKPPYPSGASARLLIPFEGGDIALAMSRSLGDQEGDSIGHLAEPTTDVLELTKLLANPKLQYMAVAASDGLFDKIPVEEIAKHVAKSLLPTNPLLPLAAFEQLIMKSSSMWRFIDGLEADDYRDDITLVVHKLTI
jgi:serine/threonine protein phosphatase PrpC